MEKCNNHSLDAINSRVCMPSLDDFEDGPEVHNIKSKQVQNRDYTNDYLDLVKLSKKICRGEELQDDEEEILLKLMKQKQEIYKVTDVKSAISQYCNIVDSNKSLEGLYLTDDSRRKEKKEFCIRFATEEKMPKADILIWYPIEYLGYYDSEACQVILCPERIKNAPTVLEKKGIHVTSKALYGMVFIHALSHAVLDCTNIIDKKWNLGRYEDKYQKIDSNFVSKEEEKQQVIFAQFMEESVATIMTLYYFLQVNTQQYKVLREWLFYQPQEYKIGLEQFDMLNNGSDLIENYCAAWRGRKKALKSYIVGVRKMNY